MTKKQQFQMIKFVCIVNLILLAGMLAFTSYGPWFNERSAVVASMLWLLSVIPAMVAAVYGVVSATKQTQKTLLVICWAALAANAVVTASTFLFR